MTYTVNVVDIEQALIDLGGEAKAKIIQDRILADRCGNSLPVNYESTRSFRQTIQRKIEDYCPQARGFDRSKKEAKFFRVAHGVYRLTVENISNASALTGEPLSGRKFAKGTANPAKENSAQAAYKIKLPAMREWLIRVAQHGRPITYGEAITAFKLDRFTLVHALAKLGRQSKELDEPILSAMVVNKKTGRCGPGFDAEFGINDVAEREKLHSFWAGQTLRLPALSSAADSEERMARFVSKEARPQQAAFRRRVFEVCSGRCVISGCDLVEALDAAHKKGRDWRKHNTGHDGYVLRKDLHALYDNDLLNVESDGTITFHLSALLQYGKYAGKKVTV